MKTITAYKDGFKFKVSYSSSLFDNLTEFGFDFSDGMNLDDVTEAAYLIGETVSVEYVGLFV